MSGVPRHGLDRYALQLEEKGFQVAIVEADGSVRVRPQVEKWLSPGEAVKKLNLSVNPNTIARYPTRSTKRISTIERFAASGLEFSIERWREGKPNYLRVAACNSGSHTNTPSTCRTVTAKANTPKKAIELTPTSDCMKPVQLELEL